MHRKTGRGSHRFAVFLRREADDFERAIAGNRWKGMPALGNIQLEIPFRTPVTLHLGRLHG